jgi:hypothetical protein
LQESRYRRIAIALAVFGQLAVTFGLPLPVFAAQNPHREVDSVCGCTAVDRAAGHCCCSSQSANRSPASPSCCAKKQLTGPNAAAGMTWHFVGGAMNERCQGSFDRALAPVAPLGFPPAAPERWAVDLQIEASPTFSPVDAATLPVIPAVPPPR